MVFYCVNGMAENFFFFHGSPKLLYKICLLLPLLAKNLFFIDCTAAEEILLPSYCLGQVIYIVDKIYEMNYNCLPLAPGTGILTRFFFIVKGTSQGIR